MICSRTMAAQLTSSTSSHMTYQRQGRLLEGEWRLETEPWIFVIGADGLVKAKFEAAVSQEEIETALRAALGR